MYNSVQKYKLCTIFISNILRSTFPYTILMRDSGKKELLGSVHTGILAIAVAMSKLVENPFLAIE